jgi:O-antigen/teichoic acid export membrane protein
MGVGRRIALNTALMLAKQAVMVVLSVVFVGYLARRLGVAAWGELQASLAITSVVTVVAGIGVRGYLAREVAVHPERGPSHLGAALAIRGVTGAALLGATVLVVLLARPGLHATLVLLAAMSQLATLLYTTMWLTFEAHERLQYIAYAEITARLLVIAIASGLLALGFGVVAAAAALMVGNLVELALTYHFVRSRFYRPELRAGAVELARIARRSMPIGLVAALSVALSEADRVLLRALCDEEAVGVFSAAWVLSESLRMLPDVFLGATFAAGMRLYARDREAFGELYRGCMAVAALLGLPIAAGVVVVAPDVIALIYGADRGYAPASAVLRLLACQVPLGFALQVAVLPLLAAKREVSIAKLLAAALVVNVALDVLLIPEHGALGAAAATLGASALALAGALGVTAGWVRRVDLPRLLVIVVATGLMAAAAWGARQLAGMWAAIAVGVLVYAALALALRAVAWADLRGLLRQRPPPPDAAGAEAQVLSPHSR